jgi:hypothetical protein
MRPSVFQVGGTIYWVLQTRNPDTMVLKDADSTPTVAVRKNGASVGDSVTVTKRSATTGIYDCSYNPAGEAEGDSFTIEESATVTGTTTSSATYTQTWNARVIAVERGTDGANVTTPPTAAAVADEVQTRTIARVTLVDTCSVNSDMRGTNDAMLAASYVSPPSAATISTQVAADLLAAHGSGSWTTATGFSTPANVTDSRDAVLAKLPAALEGGRIAAALDSDAFESINAQVVDALSVDTYAELSSPPAATSSLKDKITWMFMMLRNKVTQTSTQRKLHADDNVTVVGTESVTDDGTTYTKEKVSGS